MERLRDEFIEFLSRFGAWALWISIGVTAKLAFESRRKALTAKEKVIKVIISAFAGYMVALYWDYKGWDDTIKIAVPIGTLVGESIVEYFMENSKSIIKGILKKNIDIEETK